MKISPNEIKLSALVFAFAPLLFSVGSRASGSYNLQIKDANCKCGAVTTCYGSTCEAGAQICYSNPCSCPKCNEE